MSRPHLRAVPEPDSVGRWNGLLGEYPQAVYTSDHGWFAGALRDADDVMRAITLDALIDRLMTREQHPETPAG